MKVWDSLNREWLERDGVDANEMLTLFPARYSKTETAPAVEPVAAAPNAEQPLPPKPAEAKPPQAKPRRDRSKQIAAMHAANAAKRARRLAASNGAAQAAE